jgi:hypothetical protein
MSMYTPNCTVLLNDRDDKKICDCNNAEFYIQQSLDRTLDGMK